jgi:tRNA (guanine-N7-)-methyltransferase
MKPKHLKFPYRWAERRPLLSDQVLFVPDHYQEHQAWPFPGWEAIFGNAHPVVIEYCAGNGAWIIEKAKQSPECNWVAVEWRFDRVQKIWSKIKNLGLTNLLVVCGEALTFTREYLPEQSVHQAYINFPDPWPKHKHAKNRLFQSPFIAQLGRVVAGSVIAVTDDPPYADQICTEMLKNPVWKAKFVEPHYVTEWPDYGASFFDTLWREKGKTIRYFQFEHL